MKTPSILFKEVSYQVQNLVSYIELGDIGLPDLQRPFVWTNIKVRDLFDSMFRGYPVGYLVFWDFSGDNEGRAIGVDDKAHRVARLLIVDGQQRLTSLYAVFKGEAVLDKNYKKRNLEISFRPRDGKFDVSNAAILRDPEFIPDISVIWSSGSSSHRIISEFLERVKAKREISEEEEEIISRNFDRLFDLQNYPFTAIEIASTVDEEQVAKIFVRLNSQGVNLKQADFILTLLSVYANDVRNDLERFCEDARKPVGPFMPASPYNHFIQPTPDQMLRVAAALGFYKGRLKTVYQILRGKELESGGFSPSARDEQFDVLRQCKDKVLDLTFWHQFFGAVAGAGFRSAAIVSSEMALLYSYVFYLLGKTVFNLPYDVLDRLIGRWFFATSLTGRYTVGAPETAMDGDLSHAKAQTGADGFVNALERVMSDTLTQDFWNITLPNELETSSATSRAFFAYYAALNKLNAPVLFSDKSISDLLDPTIKRKKKALDRHHLFPRAWLEREGIKDMKLINQGANYALLEWPANIAVKDAPPPEYVPVMKKRFREDVWARMCRLHALPEGWEHLPYDEFLAQRRVLIAVIIREGFESLTK